MKKYWISALAIGFMMTACSDDPVTTESGYTMSMKTTSTSGKIQSVSIQSANAYVTEVELEKEETADSVEVEIDIEGNFNFNLLTGNSTPVFPTAMVPAGTYHELEVKMGDESDQTTALRAEATYTDNAGVSTPVSIHIIGEVELKIEDEVNGIQVDPNNIQNFVVWIDLPAVLNSLDWSSAVVNNGTITIDNQNNSSLYSQLIAALNVEVEIDDDH